MYGVIGEDRSDVEMLKNIITRLSREKPIIRTKGFSGCGELLKRAAAQLRLYQNLRCERFVVCYDADGENPAHRKRVLKERVFAEAKITGTCCALVPVREVESWILADIGAVGNVIKGWGAVFEKDPEMQDDPKKCIYKLSERNHRPKYNHVTMNEQIANFLDLKRVYDRCPSFRPLYHLVVDGTGNLDD